MLNPRAISPLSRCRRNQFELYDDIIIYSIPVSFLPEFRFRLNHARDINSPAG